MLYRIFNYILYKIYFDFKIVCEINFFLWIILLGICLYVDICFNFMFVVFLNRSFFKIDWSLERFFVNR